MHDERTIPLFPLHTVLFPAGPLPLRIFEPRYLDMISRCLRTDSGFGVCLIRSGHETGAPAETHDVGTLARITDWHQRHDGLLGITVTGGQRFRILDRRVRRDNLAEADVVLIDDEPRREMPADYLPISDMLRSIIEQVGDHYANLSMHYGDASWVSFRLAELLPIDNAQKQQLLQMDDPVQRLERLRVVLDNLEMM